LRSSSRILEIVEQETLPYGGVKVVNVKLRIGKLSGVMPDALRFAFEILSEGGITEGASLLIEEVPVELYCHQCNTASTVDDPFLVCPHCKGREVEMRAKTTLLERTVEHLKDTRKIAVIEGDIETSRDAERIAGHAIPTVQINTGGACHLDGNMVRSGLKGLDLDQIDLLIVENVGNLVCPAEFQIGEHHKVMIISVTEGDDKPLKYPLMFQVSSVLLVNKIDLLVARGEV
jgi:hydrogenase nickel insertion protein HypA